MTWRASSRVCPCYTVTLEGTGLTDGRSGETGRFVITSRAGCGQKRRAGGDVYTVSIAPTGDTAGSTAAAAVRDGGDGSYFVTYTLQIGTYRTTVSLAGVVIATEDLVITVSPAVRPGRYCSPHHRHAL